MEDIEKKLEEIKSEIAINNIKLAKAEIHQVVYKELLDIYEKTINYSLNKEEIISLIRTKMTMHANLVLQNIQ